MKRTKILFASLFMLVAFFTIGITYVNAETVKTASNLEELNDFMNDNVDVIKLNADITATDTLWWPVNGNRTLDLNGFSITSSQNIMFKMFYYGDYTAKVINSSDSTSGKINHTYTADDGKTFYLDNAISGKNKTLYIDGVELNESGRATTILCFDNNSTDNLIVKNVNSKSFDFSQGFDNYEFSNTVVRPIGTSRVQLVTGNPTIAVKDILAEGQEIYYQAFDRVGGTMTSSGVADGDLPVKDLWTNNTSDDQDNAITVRYKSGFIVSDVALSETYGYTATAKEISIKNRGTSDLQIKKVEVGGDKFEIEDGSQTTLSGSSTDETWKIKAKSGLDKGTYTATITVTDMSDNTYTSTVTLTVNPKVLTGLGIDLNDTITYGDTYEPILSGGGLGTSDYEFKYSTIDDNTSISKPSNVGNYKVTLILKNENYTASNVSKEFSITAKTITPTIENIGDETYTGNEIKPELVVKDGSTELEKDTDYTVEYANNKNVGVAKVTIKAVTGSNYTFTDTDKTFNIVAKELTGSNVSLDKTSYRHTGSEIKPELVVKDGEKTLAKDTDYELSYENNTNIGDAAIVKVIGKGNYKGEVTKNFSIIDKEPQEINFTETSVAKTYGDDNFTKTANHTQGNGTIKYTSSNTDVATVDETTGEVTIKKVGNTTIKATASATADYAQAEATYTLNIEKKEISYTATVSNKEFDNNKNATVSNVEFSGLLGSETLEKDTDYTVTAEFTSESIGDNVDVTVIITLKDTEKANNYKLANAGSYDTKANITGKAIEDSDVTLDTSTTHTYSGSEIEPNVTVKVNGTELEKGTDYTVEYTDNTNAGTGKVIVKGKGNYSGEIEKEFTINKKTITPTIENIDDVTYTGNEIKPELVVKDGSTTLVKDTDYTVAYTNNTKAGTANAKISEVALSNYTFVEVNKDFTINKYEIKADDVTLEYTSVLGDNTAKTPTITVKMGSQVVDPSNYELNYSDNTNVGTASVKVTIKTDAENYTGEVTKTFEIVNKTLLTISGISGSQEVVYTGRHAQLVGNLTVSDGINPSSLTVKWYEGTDEIIQPINVGTYKVVYSYEDDTYIGRLEVNFEIKKATPVITLGNLSQKVGSVTDVTYTIEPAKTDGTVEVLYKVEGANDTTYTTELPTEKGTYTVKVSLKNDKNLEDNEKIGTLTIAKKSSSSSGSSSSSTKTYKITVKANQKATITPSGTVEVERGESQRFKIKVKDGYEIKDVLVDGESVGAVSKYTFENVKAKHTLEVKVAKIEEKPTKTEEPTEPSQTYKDVKENVWYKKAVDYVTEKGLMNGTGNKEFSPSLTTTRGMTVTILYNLEDKPRTSKGTFSDVSDTAYYAKAVAWAGENSIVTGYGDGKFGPNDVITREQLATILYKYANYKGYDTNASEKTNVTNFSDAKLVSKYAVSAFNWACGEKLINGMGDNLLSPKGNATRAQVATILMHFCERYAK